jgi:hypothetical protein
VRLVVARGVAVATMRRGSAGARVQLAVRRWTLMRQTDRLRAKHLGLGRARGHLRDEDLQVVGWRIGAFCCEVLLRGEGWWIRPQVLTQLGLGWEEGCGCQLSGSNTTA